MTNAGKFLITTLMTASLTTNPAAADDAKTSAQPPSAKKVPHPTQIHGATLPDDYYWMRDKQNPEVAAYLEAENAYADSFMAPTASLQKKLYDALVSHIKETDTSAPYKQGDYFYYSRTEEGKQYPIYCRKRLTLDAAEDVILDQNQLAIGEKFMALGAFNVSDNA